MRFKTGAERLEYGLCPKCEGILVKASHLGSWHDDKHAVCKDCGYEVVE
jgi:hypothetical protein